MAAQKIMIIRHAEKPDGAVKGVTAAGEHAPRGTDRTRLAALGRLGPVLCAAQW